MWIKDAPSGYRILLAPLPEEAEFLERAGTRLDLIHYFPKSRRELAAALPVLMERLQRDGMIWVSWPKKASKVETDFT